jgi:hypothetical protein
MLDIAPLEPSILTNELPPIESALRKNNGWLLPPAVPFLPDPYGEMVSLDDSSGIVSSDWQSRLREKA